MAFFFDRAPIGRLAFPDCEPSNRRQVFTNLQTIPGSPETSSRLTLRVCSGQETRATTILRRTFEQIIGSSVPLPWRNSYSIQVFQRRGRAIHRARTGTRGATLR